ncbi:tetratricopeptide repeat protein [Desulfurivibrio alkaliphilus]|uniref:Methyltransferase type 12 n=1 Tax=Desulfurivibrio alkaliphilus (strain DSM 19089 / UNIQEM U267 / AHT2) TaxID=589865 RepID=D6Z1K9_DESAT|nr:tetratricopeptide repeat protein [Desulfurivibrio alkaliphilus]ADH85434.1 Methyltransferase type 12 [Desulfurivibrio alkaliphilus AHT 2]
MHYCPENQPEAEDKLLAAAEAQEQGDFQRAKDLYRDILKNCPDHLDARVALCLLYQVAGEADKGRRCFAETRRLAPPHADLHLQLGTLCHDRGEDELAIDFYRQALALKPEHHRAWYNLGTARLQRGEEALAVEAYQEALHLAPNDVDTLYNLALALTRLEKFSAAAHIYHRALAAAPDDREVLYNLGVLYRRMSRYTEALRCFLRVIEFDPDYAPALGHLGAMWVELEEKELAITFFEKLVALDHQAESARHMLAALREETPASPPKEYVASLFDHYGEKFESELMEQLGYRVPFIMAEMLREATGGQMFDRLLDLGCGTGLAGEAFLAQAAELTGVDLSAGMLAQAREKMVYDQLHQQDILEFCQQHRATYDLVVAADVLNYLGDLAPFFAEIGNLLPPGGLLLFSTEEVDCEGGFVLQENGRYAHAPGYIHKLASRHDFTVVNERRCDLRREKERWVQGRLYLLRP